MFKLSLLLILLPSISFAGQLELDVCTHVHHQPPYYLGTTTDMPEKGKRGIFADALDRTADQLHIKINWHRLPWKRCLAGFKAKQFDSLLGAVHTDERALIARFPKNKTGKIDNKRAMSAVHYHLYENRNNPLKWKGGFEFETSRFTIGSPRGFIITRMLQEKHVPVTESLSPVDGFHKLNQGRLTGYVYPKEATPYVLSKIPGSELIVRRLDPALWITYIHLPIRHEIYNMYPDIIEKLWTIYAGFIQEELP
ncbi:MAG: hypothetical protein HWE30_14100 [Methylocystaceae bacterium]|nr:hypothetical protein [Methylocystaceae bacterium]